MVEAWSKLLKCRVGENIDANYWRISDVKPILKQITKSSLSNINSVAEDGHIQLFSGDIAIDVLYVNMRSMPDAFSCKREQANLKRTFLISAGLDAFIVLV